MLKEYQHIFRFLLKRFYTFPFSVQISPQKNWSGVSGSVLLELLFLQFCASGSYRKQVISFQKLSLEICSNLPSIAMDIP